jgi:hypothetical protein
MLEGWGLEQSIDNKGVNGKIGLSQLAVLSGN